MTSPGNLPERPVVDHEHATGGRKYIPGCEGCNALQRASRGASQRPGPVPGTRSCYNRCKGKPPGHESCAEANREYQRAWWHVRNIGLRDPFIEDAMDS